MAESSYKILIRKLDEFTRKYYKNQLIRGGIYSAALLLLFFIALTILEYFGRFSSIVRAALFYAFCVSAAFILIKWVVIPLSKLYKMGKVISHDQAAKIIGGHFTNVKDKLLNVLQLQRVGKDDGYRNELLKASVDQKISELKPVSFSSAIDLSENKKHLKYLLLPLLIGVLIAVTSPEIFRDGSKRLISHSTYFEPVAPFQFQIENEKLQAVKNEDYHLKVKLTGQEIPDRAYIEVEGKRIKMNKKDKLNFSYTFKNVRNDTRFKLVAGGFDSKKHKLEALPNPVLLDFKVKMDYPSYLGKKDQELENVGDLTIPEGTEVKWIFQTKDTEDLSVVLKDSLYNVAKTGDDEFSFTSTFMRTAPYYITTSNRFLNGRDTLRYGVNVIPDRYPHIEIESRTDSMDSKRVYFRGYIKDDHGFKKLTFNYKWKGEKQDSLNKPKGLQSFPLKIDKELNQDQFYHLWNLEKLGVKAGDEIDYYFEVWDNDAINGSKSTRTEVRSFKAPSMEELKKEEEKSNEEIKNNLKESIEEAQGLQKDLKDLNKKLLNKKEMGWEEKQQVRDLLEKQKELQKKVNEIKNENKEKNARQNEYRNIDESILEKQKQLQKLFEEVMTDEMKKKFEELEKLMEKMNKNMLQEQIEDMELNSEDMEKELDRSLELFKQLEFEEKLNEAKEKLDELSEKQEELSEKTENKEGENEDLKKEQDKLNEEFEEVKKELDDLKEKNEALENPQDLPEMEEEKKSAQEEMEESSDQLEKNKNKKASDSQKKASEQMKKMSGKLSDLQMEMQSGASMEDLNNLRNILENLINLSFDQEDLMGRLNEVEQDDPRYVQLAQEQKKLRDDAKVIEDSLYALSKRVVQLKSVINREINSVNQNMDKAIHHMAERENKQAASRQQYVMTSLNNLALMLDEAVQQMQKQMQQMMSGGKCKKPGQGKKPKPSAASMKKMQQQINKRIEKMKKMMDGGKQKGGKTGKNGKGSMSKELAKLASEQAALRKKMRELSEKLNKDGKGNTKGLEEAAEKMEETEEDLVNKRITRETLKRQEEILTRLLEAENAERERELEKKRESKTAKNQNISNPEEFFEYNREKKKEVEFLKTVPPTFNTFYKNKVAGYFKNRN